MSVTRNYRQLVHLGDAIYVDLNAIESAQVTVHQDGSMSISLYMESGRQHIYVGARAAKLVAYLDKVAPAIGTYHPQLAVEHQQSAEPEPIVRGVDQFNAVWQQVLATYFAHRREIQRIEAAVGPQPPVAAITELEDFFNAFDAYMRS